MSKEYKWIWPIEGGFVTNVFLVVSEHGLGAMVSQIGQRDKVGEETKDSGATVWDEKKQASQKPAQDHWDSSGDTLVLAKQPHLSFWTNTLFELHWSCSLVCWI